MRHTATALLAATALALAGCSSSGGSEDSKPKATKETTAIPKKLEPTWGPKLTKAAGEDAEAVAACNQPSSNACARYVNDIMATVTGLDAAIKETGRAYPASQKQIAKMKDMAAEYEANGCQGDITADDPNSPCQGIVGVTIGATTLGIALQTDEVAL
jgi:hypothetical protein